jgi:gamma-glutamyl-gamma-aminobutyrate hydrolase PuuD
MEAMKIYLATLILVLSFLLKVQMQAHAATFKSQTCNLPEGQTLNIACTTDCGKFNTWALKRYAKKLGYQINITNIYSENQTPDLSKYDAILIPGGADINPDYYIQSVEPELQEHIRKLDYLVDYTSEGRQRDPFEYNLLQGYFNSKDRGTFFTPILGICRGMQMLTVSQGIPLFIDIKEELGIKNRRYTLDKVSITNKESLLYDIQKRSTFRAVELHHQGLRLDYFLDNKERWPHLDVTSVSNGGKIAESIEFYNRPVLGVQFHPEYTFGKTRRNLFSWFLQRGCMKKIFERDNK